MRFSIDPLARQTIVACAVTLPTGPTPRAAIIAQLDKIRKRPTVGKRKLAEPMPPGCRLLAGDPNVAYRVDQDADRIELLAMRSGAAAWTINAATSVRRLAIAHGHRVLAVRAVSSALVAQDATEIRRAITVGSPAGILRDRVEARVYGMEARGEPTQLFRFSFHGLTGLGLWLNEMKLGIAIGAVADQQTETLVGNGNEELAAVRSIVQQFADEVY